MGTYSHNLKQVYWCDRQKCSKMIQKYFCYKNKLGFLLMYAANL